ncbi:MAG: HD-GYP domain-containing protein [Deltaproteobacteria bacterium]|nr:HD-GYP domain-containing protein [Deltaproteobacteria bacterium]MBW2150569.1 HD-GYP domain-containing protein [Deltaproteobacteria bacterium]
MKKGYAVFGVPLKDGETAVASLIAHGPVKDGAREIKKVQTFLSHLARLIEGNWVSQKETEEMAEELAQSFESLCLYSQISTQMKMLRFSGDQLKDLLHNLIETMRVDMIFAWMPRYPKYDTVIINETAAQLISDNQNFHMKVIKQIPLDGPESQEDYFMVNNSKSLPGFAELHPEPYRFLSVKVTHQGILYGLLGLVGFNVEEIFRQGELRLLSSIAEQLAMVITNSELYGDMERFVMNVVRSLVYAIEAKDYYIKGHSERVNRYCMMMADRLKMDQTEREHLHWASILHDVGKIGIPEVILNKPEFLDQEEYGLIKNHPQKGFEILQPIEQLSGSLPGVLHHHERVDGKGYPFGLAGEEIPLLARIIAIADTFDALTTDRAYRSAITAQAALDIMQEVAGEQLDRSLFEIFKNSIKESW